MLKGSVDYAATDYREGTESREDRRMRLRLLKPTDQDHINRIVFTVRKILPRCRVDNTMRYHVQGQFFYLSVNPAPTARERLLVSLAVPELPYEE